ncbi:Npt1/Npt2 family nucleotide transporter [Paenibacillus filicis]|uniref:ADP,ATP carrier protein n=1 Tax=Paenibacillus filicis TaxID=669464 RepID=A0ABU9DQQ7_9BACL
MGKQDLRKRLGGAIGAFTADREEYVKVLLLFGYLFGVTAASIVGRTAADTMFLSRFDASALSMMYLPQALALMAAGFAYQRFAGKWRQDRFTLGLIAAVGLLSLLSRLGVAAGFPWIFPVIYIGFDVLNFLMVVCFWQFATSVLDQRKAKRMIGLVGSGGIAGGIVSGFGLKLLVGGLGTENLIIVYALLQLIGLGFVRLLAKRAGEESELLARPKPSARSRGANKPGGSSGGSFRTFMEHVPHLKYAAILAGAMVLSLVFVDYQFKLILKGTLQHDALAGFMGSFYGFSGLLALAVQLFIAGPLISRFGVMTALLIFPLALLAGSTGVLFAPVLAMAVAVKGSDKVLGDTIYSSVNQLIMLPVAPEWRGRAKGFLDGVARNGAKGLAALLLLALSPVLTAAQFSYLTLAAVVVAVVAAFRLKSAYMHTLLRSLSSQDLDLQEARLDLMDPDSRRLLTDALTSGQEAQTLYALRVLGQLEGFELASYIPALLRHPSEAVRVWALDWIREHTPSGMEAEASRLAEASDGSSVLRARAWLATAAYARDEWLEPLTGQLGDQDIQVRSAVIAGLIQYYGIEGMFRAVGVLKELISSSREEERTAVAALFGQIGLPTFYKPLLPLLQDNSVRVRVRALESAAVLRVPELIAPIIPLLADGRTRGAALDALASYDEGMLLGQVQPYLLDGQPAPAFLPQALARIGGARSFALLLGAYGDAQEELRQRLLAALISIRIKGELQTGIAEADVIEAYILSELERYWLYAQGRDELAGSPAYAEIAMAAGEAGRRTAERIFGLLALSYDPDTIRAVQANASGSDARRQASAVEVMDQLLTGKLRTAIIKLMVYTPGKGAATGAAPQDAAKTAADLLATGEPWLRTVILASDVLGSELGLDVPSSHRWSQAERSDAAAEMERVRMLSQIGLFQGLTGRELAALGASLQLVRAEGGETVIREGESGDALYIIREGTADVLRAGQRVGQLGGGDCFGEMAVLTRSVRAATVAPVGSSMLWRLDSGSFYELLFDHREIALSMMAILSRRLRTVNREVSTVPAEAAVALEETAGEVTLSAGDLQADERKNEPSGQASLAPSSGTILRRVLVLQRIGLFAHLSEGDIVQLAGMVEELRYEAGEAVVREGEPGDCLYGIIEGGVHVQREAGHRLATLGAGDCFGEMALIDGEPRSADCIAAGPTLLLRLHREQVLGFCFERLDVLKGMMRVLAVRLRDTQG